MLALYNWRLKLKTAEKDAICNIYKFAIRNIFILIGNIYILIGNIYDLEECQNKYLHNNNNIIAYNNIIDLIIK